MEYRIIPPTLYIYVGTLINHLHPPNRIRIVYLGNNPDYERIGE